MKLLCKMGRKRWRAYIILLENIDVFVMSTLYLIADGRSSAQKDYNSAVWFRDVTGLYESGSRWVHIALCSLGYSSTLQDRQAERLKDVQAIPCRNMAIEICSREDEGDSTMRRVGLLTDIALDSFVPPHRNCLILLSV